MHYVEDKAQFLPAGTLNKPPNSVQISATELRRQLEYGLKIPDWYTPQEVMSELKKAYPPRHRQGFTIKVPVLNGTYG
ncbi:MAG: hypothetical protein DRH12_15180 [Deltaproteobacteria bacterium]|nr:MAG: hypothetical protein DRH12_15180 [Deltaproteobacteria bacterium]